MNIPGILLAILLIWWSIVHLGLTSPFGIFVLITGIVWAIVSVGVHSGTFNRP
jgi:hypothetical protein